MFRKAVAIVLHISLIFIYCSICSTVRFVKRKETKNVASKHPLHIRILTWTKNRCCPILNTYRICTQNFIRIGRAFSEEFIYRATGILYSRQIVALIPFLSLEKSQLKFQQHTILFLHLNSEYIHLFQSGRNNPTYVNINGTSQASLQAYPAHWAENYSVPADARGDSTTYCLPYTPEQIVYTIPVPKKDRKKKQEEQSHTYTNVPNLMKKQGNPIEPNYAQVMHGKEPSYAKVLPKCQRKVVDVSPYSSVMAQGCYAQPQEPMYCEPQINK